MNVLFVNPNVMQPPVAPLAVDYIGSALRHAGISVALFDMCLGTTDAWKEGLSPSHIGRSFSKSPPSAVLFTLRNIDDAYFSSRDCFLAHYRDLVRSLRQKLGVPVIVGGCGFSVAPDALLAYLGADFGVQGACEHDLLCLLGSLGEPDRFPSIPGLVWRDNGAIRLNPASPPRMAEDFFSSRATVDNVEYYRRGGMVGVETKRGCSGRCSYCVDPIAKGSEVFTKPTPFLIEEIKSLLDRGIKVFHLCDSEFNVPPWHAMEVCSALKDEGLGRRIRWYTYASPRAFDESLAWAMAEAGCVGINFGVDHCDPQILAALGRSHTAEDLEQAAKAAAAAGIVVLFDLLLGGPGETRQSLEEVIDFCRGLEVARVGTPVGVRVYPNTPLAGEVLRQGPLETNPNLRGAVRGNDDFLLPLFYLSASLGDGWESYLRTLVGDDEKFLLPLREKTPSNYNYNANELLVEAIGRGHKGAFWDILRRVHDGLPPLEVP